MDKPDRIWRFKEGLGCPPKHSTEKIYTDSTEYIRADLLTDTAFLESVGLVRLTCNSCRYSGECTASERNHWCDMYYAQGGQR